MRSQQDDTSLYKKGASWIHNTHPFNKLSYILLTGTVVYCAPGGWAPDAALLALGAALAATSGLFAASWRIMWRTLLPLALFMVPIHCFLYPGNHTLLVSWRGGALYLEGLQFAGIVLLQLATILMASLLFVFSTHPADFITSITQAGWPPPLAYLFGSPLLLLPAMRTRIGVIQSAQRARGLDSEGSLLQRIKAVAPLVAPFVLGALVDIEQRAVALEVRGFNAPPPRTSWRIVADSPAQRIARWLMLFLSLFFITYRFLG